MKRDNSRLTVAVLAGVLLAALCFWGWRHFNAAANVETVGLPVASPAPALPAPALSVPVAAEPSGPEHPVEVLGNEAASALEPLPALNGSDNAVTQALTALLGRKSVFTFLQLDGFVRRTVATVDNLARSQASARLWPVNPTPGRFSTEPHRDGLETIHPDNGQRYAALLQVIESVDTVQAVAAYRRFYPLFQQAYEELGFPKGYFNDRLVQVLDHLIATPVPSGPLAVSLVAVKGSVPSLRPWVRYEFADPELQAQSAGRKMLLRTGPDNQRRLQAKLVEIRRLVAP